MPDREAQADQRYRARVFVDFWNYTLSMRGVEADFRTDWSKLGPVLAEAAIRRINPRLVGDYQGINFHGSYDPRSEKDRRMHHWATRVVARFPGVSVSIVSRQKKRSPPKCPRCHNEVAICPGCGADMRGTEEKGVDVRMATDMISLAWVDNYECRGARLVRYAAGRTSYRWSSFSKPRALRSFMGRFRPKVLSSARRAGASSMSPIFARTSVW